MYILLEIQLYSKISVVQPFGIVYPQATWPQVTHVKKKQCNYHKPSSVRGIFCINEYDMLIYSKLEDLE